MLQHININVMDFEKSKKFYKIFLAALGYKSFLEEEGFIGFSDGKTTEIFLEQVHERFKEKGFHRKCIGLNHLAFGVDSKEKVDEVFKNVIKKNKWTVLYGGPKEYPEYCKGYYAVYFEDPDRIKLEVCFIPKGS